MSVDIKVGLEEYEKKLLDDFYESFFSPESIDTLIPYLNPELEEGIIYAWSWTQRIALDASMVCHSDDWIANHGNSAVKAWPVILRFWEHDSMMYYCSNHSRLALLMQKNPGLESRFKTTQTGRIPALQLQLAPSDEKHWKMVAMMRMMVDDEDDERRKLVIHMSQSQSLDAFDEKDKEMISRAVEKGLDPLPGNEELENGTKLGQHSAVEIESILSSWKKTKTFEVWSLVQICCSILRSSQEYIHQLDTAPSDCGFPESHFVWEGDFIHMKQKDNEYKVSSEFLFLFHRMIHKTDNCPSHDRRPGLSEIHHASLSIYLGLI